MQQAPWSQGPSHLGLELSSPGVGVGRSVARLRPQNRLNQVSRCTAWPPVPLMGHWLRTPGEGPLAHIVLIPNLLPPLLSEPCLPAPLPLPVGPWEAKQHLTGKRTALV